MLFQASGDTIDSSVVSLLSTSNEHSAAKKARPSLSVSFNGDLEQKIAQFQKTAKTRDTFEDDVLPEDFKPPEHSEVR